MKQTSMQTVDTKPIVLAEVLGPIYRNPMDFLRNTEIFALLEPKRPLIGTCETLSINSGESIQTEFPPATAFIDKIVISKWERSLTVFIEVTRPIDPVNPTIASSIGGSFEMKELELAANKHVKGEFSAPQGIRDAYLYHSCGGVICIKGDTVTQSSSGTMQTKTLSATSWQYTQNAEGNYQIFVLNEDGSMTQVLNANRALEKKDIKLLGYSDVHIPDPRINCFLTLPSDGQESHMILGTVEGLFFNNDLVPRTGDMDIMDITCTAEDGSVATLSKDGWISMHMTRPDGKISPPSKIGKLDHVTHNGISHKILTGPALPAQVIITSWSVEDTKAFTYKRTIIPPSSEKSSRIPTT